MILGDVFERNARCYGGLPAVRFEGHTLTHRELADRICRLVDALSRRGVKRGDRVAILSRNLPEYLEIYGAAGWGGFMGLGLNYRLSAPEQLHILQDAEPAVLLYESHYAGRVAELRPHLPSALLYVEMRPQERAPLPPATTADLSYEALLQEGKPMPPKASARPDDTLFLIYTSGTTGKPKGAMLGNEAQLEQARVQAMSHAAQPTDRMLIVMPFYHIGGPTELLTFLCMGATIVLHREFDAHAILQSIEAERVSAAHLAPTMIQMMLDELERQPYDLSSLHTVCYASAPMSTALSKRARSAFGPIFMQIYGMTENGLGTALLKHQHIIDGSPPAVKRLASAGQPYLGTDIRILRADGEECAPHEPGEILIRSASLMQGYWKQPEATAKALIDGWLHTGDIGYFDDEHYLFVVDRKKDMIVSGGENIYSREVEEALVSHPAVLEAAVIGVPDATWGESVHAFVVCRAGERTDADTLIQHCRSLIASYKKPRAVTFLPELPRVPSTRKIDKQALRKPFWRDQNRQVS